MFSFGSITSKAQWYSWLARRPVTAEVEGSSPFWVVLILYVLNITKWVIILLTRYGRLAQLGEHLPYKQGVIGSSPIATIVPTWLNWQSSWLVISRLSVRVRSSAYTKFNDFVSICGGVPEWPKGADCKSVAIASKVRILLPPYPITRDGAAR